MIHTQQTALEESRKQLSSMLERMPTAVIIIHPSSGKIQWLNPAGEELLKLSSAEAVRHNMNEMMELDFLDTLQQQVQRHGTFKADQARLLNHLGEERIVLLQASIMEFEGDRSLMLNGMDITEQHYMKQRILKQQETIRLVYEGSRDGIWDWNRHTGQVQCGGSFQQMLGWADDELPKTIQELQALMHPEDVGQWKMMLELYLQQQISDFAVEYRMRRKTGYYLWFRCRGTGLFDENGFSYRFVGVMSDINDLKHTLSKLKVKEQQFASAFGQSYHGQCILNANGEILRANPAMQERLKRNKLHTLSEPALTHPEDLDSWERLLEDMRQSKQDKVQTTKRYVREDGETVWTKVSVGSVLNRQKQVEYFVLHIEDIHELREAQEIAMQSSKLAAVGETAASLVHELKAPLGAIRLKSEMCKRSLEMDKPVPAKKFDEIIRIVDKTNEILQHMRNFTRRSDHTQKGPVSIEEVLQETLLLLRPEFNRLGIRLETQLTPHLPHIFANNIQVEQVLINLLHNARDALEEQATKQITVRLKPAGEQVVLEIQDSGCGMSPEVQQKIFESFYTTKAVGKGTGLGMSIVRRILLEHDASIEVESAVGEGTTFQICFPIAAIIQHKLAAARSA